MSLPAVAQMACYEKRRECVIVNNPEILIPYRIYYKHGMIMQIGIRKNINNRLKLIMFCIDGKNSKRRNLKHLWNEKNRAIQIRRKYGFIVLENNYEMKINGLSK